MKRYLWIISIGLLAAAFIWWLYSESKKSVLGERIEDLGRDHVQVGTEIKYNSNPPTSGSHFADWTRAGVYESPQEDGYLVHSLEHGYVILSYNCKREGESGKGKVIREAYAHGLEEGGEATSSSESTTSAKLSDEFKNTQCHRLVDQLISVYEKKGKKKLIVVPRPNLDSRIALTAWGRVDKMDAFDSKRVEQFIDNYRNRGPEKTME